MSRTVNMPALAYIISTQPFLLRYFYLQISRCLVLMVLRTVSACDILQNRAPRREQCHILCGDRASRRRCCRHVVFYTRSKLFADVFFFDWSGASRVILKWRPVRRVGSPEAEWRPGEGRSTVCSLSGWRIPSATFFSSLHFFLEFTYNVNYMWSQHGKVKKMEKRTSYTISVFCEHNRWRKSLHLSCP